MSSLLRSSRGLSAGILPRTALYNCQKNLFHTTPAAVLQQSSRVLTPENKTTTTTQAAQNNEVDEKKRDQNVANDFIEAVLYGSKKTKEEDNQTHSKTLARGKYVHELQKHKVKPEKVEEYINLVTSYFPKMANDPRNELHLCGSWETVIGELDTFVHIWEYKGYPGHRNTLQRLAQDPEYNAFLKQLRPLLISRENNVMLEFSFWKTSPPMETDGIYELRHYQLKPGRLLEWETEWRKGLECRRQYCEPVGAWFSQLGELHSVHHMWTYPDLQTRKTTREDAWNVDGWAETVYKTVRLVDNMSSYILKPLSYSPLR
ncbi:NIPSNAP-domain-containing protein [Circinella umbellata]|nr:NIPSNAP-domain-containing protein [Circinella umbellata]